MEPVDGYEICKTCLGDGTRAYSDTAHGRGAGGQTITVGTCNYCNGVGTIPTVETFRKAVSHFLDRYGEVAAKELANQFAPALAVFLPDVEPHPTLRRRVMHWMVLYSEQAA